MRPNNPSKSTVAFPSIRPRRWFMSTVFAAGLLGTFGTTSTAPAAEIELKEQWSLVASENDLLQTKIQHYVSDSATWKFLWDQLDPKADVPKVDFDESIVLLHARDKNDPNQYRFRIRVIDPESKTIELMGMATRKGFQPSDQKRLMMFAIDRKDVGYVQAYDKSTRKNLRFPVDSTRVIAHVTIPATVPDFENETVELHLYEFDPRLADVSATLIQKVVQPNVSHQSGTADHFNVVAGMNDQRKADRNYYVTFFILKGAKRTHIGEANGKQGLVNVLDEATNLHFVSLIVRSLGH